MIEKMPRLFPALLLLPLLLPAQDSGDLRGRIEQERRAGRIAAMEPLLQQLLIKEEERLNSTHIELIPALEQLAKTELALAKFDDAKGYYLRIVNITEIANDANSPALLTPLANLVRLYHIAGKYEDAETVLLRKIAIRVKSTGATHPDVAADYNTLAKLYAAQSKFAQSANVYGWALEILEKNFGVEDPRLLTSLDGLAANFRQDRQDAIVEEPLVRALAIREIGRAHV